MFYPDSTTLSTANLSDDRAVYCQYRPLKAQDTTLHHNCNAKPPLVPDICRLSTVHKALTGVLSRSPPLIHPSLRSMSQPELSQIELQLSYVYPMPSKMYIETNEPG